MIFCAGVNPSTGPSSIASSAGAAGSSFLQDTMASKLTEINKISELQPRVFEHDGLKYLAELAELTKFFFVDL